MFPEPASQAKAVSVFAGSGALGNGLGVIIGGLFVSFAIWHWAFWFVAIVAVIVVFTCAVLIPSPSWGMNEPNRSLDIIGVSILTGSDKAFEAYWADCSVQIVAPVLFIFAVTSGSTDGWKTATVLAPLVLSVLLIFIFFVWEARIPEENAALPPRMWLYPNFTVLSLLALLPYTWWSSVYLLYAWLWQEVYGWNTIISAVHFLPIGIFAFPFMAGSGFLRQKFSTKRVLLSGLGLMFVGTILLPFADRPSRYYPLVFLAFLIGTAGTTLVFATTNIAIFAATPSAVAGTVGAVFNWALQLGTALFTAAITSIQTSVQDSPTEYKGRAAGFWFLLVLVVVQVVSIALFFKEDEFAQPKEGSDMTSKGSAATSCGVVREYPVKVEESRKE